MPKTIVILGGGFAGVYVASFLERLLPGEWQLILFSQENHFTFTPLLAEVVGASISPLHVVRPIRQMLRRTECRTANVTRLKLETSEVEYQLPGGRVAMQAYDHLVLACGMVVNTNILPGAAAHALPLKTLGDALFLRNRVIGQLEQAEVETDPERRRHLLSYAVIGAGFSGVEVAGEIFDLITDSRRFYPCLRRDDFRVTVIHNHERVLPELPESLGQYARRRMEARGILFCLGKRAQAVTEAGVRLADDSVVGAGTVVCTIGNTLAPLIAGSALPLDRGRVVTDPDMRVKGHANVWALGDCALVPNARDGKPSPTLAQFALRQAKQLAANVRRTTRGEPTAPFSFRMLGEFAAIGHHNAVGEVLGLKISGFIGWFLWRAVYLGKMPTLGRKLQVAMDWAWDLFIPRDIVQLSTRETRRVPRAHYEPGEFIYRQGEPANKFYVIEKGKAAMLVEGWPEPVLFLGEGDHFGEGVILRSAIRRASVRAEEPLDVLTIDRGTFQDLLNHLSLIRTQLDNRLARLEATWRFRDVIRVHPKMTGTPVREAMNPTVRVLSQDMTLREAIHHVHRHGHDLFGVVDEASRLCGVCTVTDLEHAVCRLLPPTTPLADIMTRPVLTVLESKSLAEATYLILQHPVKRLVVVAGAEAARPVGLLTAFDIIRHFTVEDV
jgi:NADH dehydrogenase